MNVNSASSHARDQKIVANLPLVRHVLRQMGLSNGGGISDGDDLASCGTLGLIAAVDNFDPERQASLATYAHVRIRGAILDGLRRTDSLSRTYRSAAVQIEQSHGRLRNSLLREPTRNELFQASGLGVEKFAATRLVESLQPATLDSVESEGGFQAEVADTSVGDPTADLEQAELLAALATAIELLPERQRFVLSLCYKEGLRMWEVADVLGVSPTRASQLRQQALRRLRGNTSLQEAA
jgi:RNA polymerase sigma factor for flagellar operon FliA